MYNDIEKYSPEAAILQSPKRLSMLNTSRHVIAFQMLRLNFCNLYEI